MDRDKIIALLQDTLDMLALVEDEAYRSAWERSGKFKKGGPCDTLQKTIVALKAMNAIEKEINKLRGLGWDSTDYTAALINLLKEE